MDTSIREIQAYETWALRQQVMWPNMPISYVKIKYDHKGTHYGLYQDDMLTSVISLFVENRTAQFRKFATLKSAQGKGLGSLLLTHLLTQVHEQNIHRTWCNARADKASFYERFGFTSTAEKFSKGGIEYVIMEKLTD